MHTSEPLWVRNRLQPQCVFLLQLQVFQVTKPAIRARYLTCLRTHQPISTPKLRAWLDLANLRNLDSLQAHGLCLSDFTSVKNRPYFQRRAILSVRGYGWPREPKVRIVDIINVRETVNVASAQVSTCYFARYLNNLYFVVVSFQCYTYTPYVFIRDILFGTLEKFEGNHGTKFSRLL